MRKFLLFYLSFFLKGIIHSQTFSFSPAPGSPISIPTSTGSNRCVISSDLNSDGKKDLLTGNSYGANICYLHGIGGGQFTLAPVSPIVVNNGPNWFTLGDFNADGREDLAIAKYYTNNSIGIYNGTAANTFTQAAGSPYVTGNQPYHIDKADFNMDGKLDIITSNANSGTTHVFLGTGTSSFVLAAGFPINTGLLSDCVITGKFNSDNFPDFAVSSVNGNSMQIYLGNGSGGFTQAPGSPYTINPGAICIRAKDLNSDGLQDIVAASFTSTNLHIFLASATGSMIIPPGSPITVPNDPYDIAIADFDMNGTNDLVVSHGAGNMLRIFSGNGNGTFSIPTFSVINGLSIPHSIHTDDFNNDGRPDIAALDWTGNNLHVFLNTSTVCPLSASYTSTYGTNGAVNFTSTSTGTTASTSYSWNFGDSSGGTGATTSHTYTSNGTYTVTLTVTNSTVAPSCVQNVTAVVTVTNACPINTSFTYTNTGSGTVNFNSASTGTNASTVYSWNFGDSNTGAGTSASNTYTANGTYTVIFTVVNTSTPNSCFVTQTTVITIANACPIAGSFSATNMGNGVVNFNSSVTGTTTGAIYNWDFGDNTSGSGTSTSHQYTANGVYTVTFTVVNLTNPPCSKTYTQVITINDAGTSGLQSFLNVMNLKIYPNPASDKLFIDFDGVTPLNTEIIIYSVLGNEVMHYELRSFRNEMELENIANGFYYYSVRNSTSIIRTGQLILQK